MTLKAALQKRREIMRVNEQAIVESNARMLPRLLKITGVLMCIPILLSTVKADLRNSVVGYALVLAVCVALALVFRVKRMKKYSLIGMYLLFTSIFALVLYLSMVVFRDRYAASVLSFFCVMPLLFIDRQWRLNSIVIIFYIIHTVLAFKIKGPEIAGVDAVNCLVSVFLGISAGTAVLGSQLGAIEVRRRLVIEKETDVLTGLKNRRKLFETISLIEEGQAEKPAGILMLDIDHFKEVNDTHGHIAGDRCLSCFGALLSNFEKLYDIRFYRYGGEEFVGLAYGGSEQELVTLAESIRLTVSKKKPGELDVTVSIGEVWCGGENYKNLELWIDRADKAVYEAKTKGRDSLYRYLPDGSIEVYSGKKE